MSGKVVPMIDVPDVKAATDWYASIGFKFPALAAEVPLISSKPFLSTAFPQA